MIITERTLRRARRRYVRRLARWLGVPYDLQREQQISWIAFVASQKGPA